MNKILTLFKREYRAAVRTKSFIISLVLVPFLIGVGLLAMVIMEKKQDTDDKRIVVIDHSGLMADRLKEALDLRNQQEIYHTETGEKVKPAYVVEFVAPDTDDIMGQQLKLSDRVKTAELHAFIEIGPDVLHPSGKEGGYLRYYSEHSFMDNARDWFRNTINGHLQQLRVADLNLDKKQSADLFTWINIEGMGLVTVDKKTGEQLEAEKVNELQSFMVPYIIVLMMFMLVMMSSVPLLTAVMEEKTEKIAEVLLGTITPFQFMMGKVLGGIGISLTTAAIYVTAGIVTARMTGFESVIPYDILPWFFIYIIFFIIMVGSGMAALGATCNDNKDAQSIQFPAILPVILPLFLIMPVIQNPTGTLATTLSFIPPFTPSIIMIRLATPVTIPLWQPIVGLVGVILFTIFTVWVGARIFRTAILIQGQKPSVANLFKYAFKG
ncbi:MAG: ABC transporter permease [Bacteroidales bacterium]|nr:ABC transporter permease [Bacteroidales bacterium]